MGKLTDLLKKAARMDLTTGLSAGRTLSEKEKRFALHGPAYVTLENNRQRSSSVEYSHNKDELIVRVSGTELRTTEDHSIPGKFHTMKYRAFETTKTYTEGGKLKEVHIEKFHGTGGKHYGATVTFDPPGRLIGERDVYWRSLPV